MYVHLQLYLAMISISGSHTDSSFQSTTSSSNAQLVVKWIFQLTCAAASASISAMTDIQICFFSKHLFWLLSVLSKCKMHCLHWASPSYFGTLMAPHWHQYPKNQRCTPWPFAHRCHDLATTSPWSYKSLPWSWTLNIIALAASFHFLQTSLFQNATFAFQRASVQRQLISPLPFWLHWWHIRGGANE